MSTGFLSIYSQCNPTSLNIWTTDNNQLKCVCVLHVNSPHSVKHQKQPHHGPELKSQCLFLHLSIRYSHPREPTYWSRQSLSSPSPVETEMDMLVLRERSRRGIRNNGYDVSNWTSQGPSDESQCSLMYFKSLSQRLGQQNKNWF